MDQITDNYDKMYGPDAATHIRALEKNIAMQRAGGLKVKYQKTRLI